MQVYSFGVTLWEVLEKKRPYGDMEGFQIQAQWYMGQNMKLPRVSIPETLKQPSKDILTALANLVEDCTNYDPDK